MKEGILVLNLNGNLLNWSLNKIIPLQKKKNYGYPPHFYNN